MIPIPDDQSIDDISLTPPGYTGPIPAQPPLFNLPPAPPIESVEPFDVVAPKIVPSVIRTVVPLVAGFVLTWLVSAGVNVSSEQVQGVVYAALTTLYYWVARLLETRVSDRFGVLLGSRAQPLYPA